MTVATEELFDRYQKNKRITLTFERPEKLHPIVNGVY